MNKAILFSAALLLSSCAAPAQPADTESHASSQAMRGQAVSLPADPEHGQLTRLAIGALGGMGETLANGSAAVWMFQDGFSRVHVQLNVAAAPTGRQYVAWLKDGASSTVEKLGTLRNTQGDVRHSLSVESRKDYKRYSILTVTLESSEGVSTPGREVANGILKETAR